MKLEEALTLAKKYSSIYLLDSIISASVRNKIIRFCITIFFTVAIFLLGLEFGVRNTLSDVEYSNLLDSIFSYSREFLLFFTTVIVLFIIIYPLQSYYRYFVLSSLKRIFGNNDNRIRLTYEAASALIVSEKGGFVRGLLSVSDSNFIMNRLLINPSDVSDYEDSFVLSVDGIVPEYNDTITLGSLWKLFYENSEELRSDLLSRKIQKEIYHDTCDWLDRILEDEKRTNSWWWRENLSKIRGIGKSLSYGMVGYISKYAGELVIEGGLEETGKISLHNDSVKKLEEALSKSHGANAVIVGEEGTGRHTVVKILSKMIDQGDCYSEIEHKRVFEFDNNVLGSLSAEDLSYVLGRCFDEAIIAKNIIFVINDLPLLSDMVQKQGADLFQLIDRYISHPYVSVVCICDQPFYQNEKHKVLFDRDFEIIHIEEMNNKLLVPYIQDNAIIVEKLTGKFFSSYSVNAIALALNKYFVEDAPLVKASDLMYKIAINNSRAEHIVIDEESISDTIKSITGVSTGEINDDEKDKLLNLESILHKKIINQDEAIKLIASTMRRSRTGMVNANKPIGSFLFLGPTGVGKTETAKTLAEVFFGSEDHMSRIDMNEYTMENSSYRILGDANQEGDLAKLVHKRPYGVLLLDEFEKSTRDVKDVFLRVLDEGIFTNGAGKVISARTQIIIATSNAGSPYIRESGLSPNSTKDEVDYIKSKLIDQIISDDLFRPELINRFDAVIMFHPLGNDSRILIAKKMLEALRQRTLLQGYDITFTDALVQKVLGGEGDVMFGGRSIQRNIQTEVEDALARKIIEGSLQRGGVVIIDAEDIK